MTKRYQSRTAPQSAPARPQPKASIDITDALTDRNLLGAALGNPASWARWLSVLRAAYSLPMNASDLASFREVAGDRTPPQQRVRELWATVGRRSGKSRVAAALAVYAAAFIPRRLAHGETGVCLVLAASQAQARVVFNYCEGFLNASPILRREIVGKTQTEIKLRNGNTIAIQTNSHRVVRGKTLLCAIFDEVAQWRDLDAALPDIETYRAVLPALVTTNGMLIGISSPYRKLGLLYQKHREHFAQDNNDVLVVQGASSSFNPTLDQKVIDAASSADPEAAIAEWGGEFRADISSFLDDETIERVTDYSRPLELPPRQGIQYQSFTDPSGGRHDAFTIAVGHREGAGSGAFYVIDAIRGVMPPFDPQNVVSEYASLLKDYKIGRVVGDAYAAAWVESAFTKAGISYTRSELNKSQLYIEALPLFMRQAISIPNHSKLQRELRLLERRTSRMGKDAVDHGPHGTDDFANSVAGVLRCLATNVDVSMSWISGDADENVAGKQSHSARVLLDYLRGCGVNV